ncbi:unnamed protein product, partial [Ectocarpus sp. 12 AP-2014]
MEPCNVARSGRTGYFLVEHLYPSTSEHCPSDNRLHNTADGKDAPKPTPQPSFTLKAHSVETPLATQLQRAITRTTHTNQDLQFPFYEVSLQASSCKKSSRRALSICLHCVDKASRHVRTYDIGNPPHPYSMAETSLMPETAIAERQPHRIVAWVPFRLVFSN